jgi:hypothetical protein
MRQLEGQFIWTSRPRWWVTFVPDFLCQLSHLSLISTTFEVEMADILAFNLTQTETSVGTFKPRLMNDPDLSTKLKLMGVDVSRFNQILSSYVLPNLSLLVLSRLLHSETFLPINAWKNGSPRRRKPSLYPYRHSRTTPKRQWKKLVKPQWRTEAMSTSLIKCICRGRDATNTIGHETQETNWSNA